MSFQSCSTSRELTCPTMVTRVLGSLFCTGTLDVPIRESSGSL